jgi:hypothetical protein
MVPVIRYRVRTERNQSPGHGSFGLYVIVLSAGSLSGATRADRSPAALLIVELYSRTGA